MTVPSTDCIIRTTTLRAPQERVWRAISHAQEFGTWFGVELDGAFVPGARISARIVPTKVDPDVARMQEPHVGTPFDIFVERVEPMRLLAFRWHPYAVEPADYSREPTTLVVFELEAVSDGTVLTITESGFDAIPLARRAEAFASNEHGWTTQLTLIEQFLAQRP